MKAVGLYKYLPIEDPESLIDIDIPEPSPSGRDLLVEVKAISVNPVDTKQRRPKDKVETTARVLGWDAAGTVVAVGPDCKLFKPGDDVFYAGDITRGGSNSQLHVVDERIVGRKPRKLSFAESAALPLTALTAWEALYDRLQIARPPAKSPGSILIFGGAGGVGSLAIQFAKKLTGMNVIATASRPESSEWVFLLGADRVVDHHGDIAAQLSASGIDSVDYALILNNTDVHFPIAAQLIAPQGKICSIVETKGPIDVAPLMRKSASFHWELMFTRSIFKTADMDEQHRLLNDFAGYVDEGVIQTTLRDVLSPINAANLRDAHARLERGHTIGKIVLEGW
jgi:NADPH:quinone reductase